MTEREQRLLKKLKIMSEQGFAGEKEAAKNLLDKMMKKLGITSSDLEIEEEKFYSFKIHKGKMFDKLFWQVVSSVTDLNKVKYIQPSTYEYELLLKPEVAVELKAKYEFYSNALKEDLEIFLSAFIHLHNLYPTVSVKGAKVVQEDKNYKKIQKMAFGMEKHQFLKQIEKKGD